MNTTIFDACMPVSSVAEDQFELVTLDLYRNIHKGIRAELFNITQSAGRIDPCSRVERARLAEHIIAVGDLLAMHAHQEDTVIDPVLHAQLPDLAGVVELDHAVLGRLVLAPALSLRLDRRPTPVVLQRNLRAS